MAPSLDLVLVLFLVFQLKHFVADFLLQGPYQYLNKGKYGHPGGLVHAGIHGCFSCFLYIFASPLLALVLIVMEMAVHYHVDWAKMAINKAMGWGPTTHEEFWYLLGLDQMLHQLTYLAMIWVLVRG